MKGATMVLNMFKLVRACGSNVRFHCVLMRLGSSFSVTFFYSGLMSKFVGKGEYERVSNL